jgi:hypothetical protein
MNVYFININFNKKVLDMLTRHLYVYRRSTLNLTVQESLNLLSLLY